jgi:hypothetical protein
LGTIVDNFIQNQKLPTLIKKIKKKCLKKLKKKNHKLPTAGRDRAQVLEKLQQ